MDVARKVVHAFLLTSFQVSSLFINPVTLILVCCVGTYMVNIEVYFMSLALIAYSIVTTSLLMLGTLFIKSFLSCLCQLSFGIVWVYTAFVFCQDKVESLFPKEMEQNRMSLEKFMVDGLPSLNQKIDTLANSARSRGCVLRYVATIKEGR